MPIHQTKPFEIHNKSIKKQQTWEDTSEIYKSSSNQLSANAVTKT